MGPRCQVMSYGSGEMVPQIHDLMMLSIRSQAKMRTYVVSMRT
jgi:hypothetical protein